MSLRDGILQTINLPANPLVLRGVRMRLRPGAALSAALITLTVASFIYIASTTGITSNTPLPDDAGPEDVAALSIAAARSALVPLIILQGIILMVLGTGAAAGGMARERTDRMLDYHRLSPMPPHQKILGLMFGLSIREYLMFALVLPFVGYAAYKGEVPVFSLVKFYVVFFTSVWLYHLTGMVAGMIVDKPWRAGFVVQGLVFGLYFMLPRLSGFGLTFLEFLTARPAFYGIVQEHLMLTLPDADGGQDVLEQGLAKARSERWQAVPFFNQMLHPLLYSLMVQGLVIGIIFSIIHRRWIGATRLLFSKPTALLFYALIQLFIVGSLLGLLWHENEFIRLMKLRSDIASQAFGRTDRWVVWRMLGVTLAASGVFALLLIHATTPGWHRQVNALRKVRQAGGRWLSPTSDAASPWPMVMVMIAIAGACFLLVAQQADVSGRAPDGVRMGMAVQAVVFLSLVLLCVQMVREIAGEKLSIMVGFVAWVIPFLAWIILFAALHMEMEGLLAALPCPVAPLYLVSILMVYDPSKSGPENVFLPGSISDMAQDLVVVSIVLYGLATIVLLGGWLLRRHLLHRAVGEVLQEEEQAGLAGSN